MLTILLAAQVAAAIAPVANDSTYATPALREIVAAAAAANRRPPPELRSYTSRIETETSLILRDTLGRERSGEVEQLATRASWSRDGRYQLHIVGYRSQSVGVPYSTLSIVRGWTVPSLYGERLSVGIYSARPNKADTLRGVHPFAADRDRFYRFTGGDTITVLHAGARDIPIVRIRVRPALSDTTALAVFDGEIDLDATRSQIVRMRGQFLTLGRLTKTARVVRRLTGLVAAAFVEFVNAEVAGKYWLPAFQRTEFQATVPLLMQQRAVFRIVSSIHDIVVNDTSGIPNDSVGPPRVIVSWASNDSVSHYDDWQRAIGEATGAVHSDDFMDMAPESWKPDGPPRFTLFPTNMARIARFNAVEGVFVGLSPTVDFRSLAPGLSAGAFAGWAFAERTARGGGFVTLRREQSGFGVRAERALASTNDFSLPLEDNGGFNADYVDRRSAMLSATRLLRSVDVGLLTAQVGVGSDRPESTHVTRLPSSLLNRQNRGARSGRYGIGMADLEWHPNVSGDFVQPGIGGRLHYEAARGGLTWQRIELRLAARRYLGPISFAAHADGGILLGANPPPQQLFEIGGNAALPGYAYKAFAGDRAALLRSFASYRFGIWQRPVHFIRDYVIPGLGPGLAASVQGGWTGISSPAVAAAVRELGVVNGNAVSTATNGVRATVGGGLTLFSDLLHVGVARPIGGPAATMKDSRLRFVFGFGANF